jgi:hypothetical protein
MTSVLGGGSASASCGGGKTVTCSGSECHALTNEGCICQTGDQTDRKLCEY